MNSCSKSMNFIDKFRCQRQRLKISLAEAHGRRLCCYLLFELFHFSHELSEVTGQRNRLLMILNFLNRLKYT